MTPSEVERVREALREYVSGFGYGGQTEAAKRLKISQPHIGRIIRAEKPEDPGMPLAWALGLAVRGDRFAFLDRTETRVERDTRYPNLDATVPFFLANGGAPAAVERVRSYSLKSERDQSAARWLADLQDADAAIRREAAEPVAAKKARMEAGAKADAELHAKVARGETAEPGWPPKKRGK